MDVSGGESKVWYSKEQYCIRTWNVRTMNQGKLGMVQAANGKSPKCSTWVQSQKWQNDPGSCPRQLIHYHRHPRIKTDLQYIKPKKKKKKWCPFIIEYLTAKLRSQERSGVTGKFSLGVQNVAGQILTELCQENTWVIANTLFQQHKWWFNTRISPDGQYWNQIDYNLCSRRWRRLI